jgi:hypothetical protein
MPNLRFRPFLLAGIGFILALGCVPATAQIVVNNNDVTMKFGFLGQMWADWTQDSTGAQNYQQNFFLRRLRFIMAGDIGNQISFFFDTDDPKLGITPKNLAGGFIVQDALIEWKPRTEFQVNGGLFIVPFTRIGLQSAPTFITVDASATAVVNNAALQTSGLRDTGFQFRGYLANERLQYRIGEFAGERDSNGRNSPRTTGYLQYDFFDREKSYLFNGTFLGKQKILAVDAGFDRQSAYRGYSVNVAAAIPVNQGDEVASQFQYIHYDGKTRFLAVPDQNDYLLEAAYYSHKAKIQPFMKYETQAFVAAANTPKDINRAGFGANYYIRGQNLKWTAEYLRAMPQTSTTIKPTNEFTIQLQLMYF